MMRKPFLISIALHVIVMILVTIEIKNPFSHKLKDNPFAVFEYVEIGDKSKAPILSDRAGHASKTKSQTKEKETIIQEKQPEESAPEKVKEKEQPKKDAVKEKKVEDDKKIAVKDKKQKPEKSKKKPEEKNKKINKKPDNKAKTDSKSMEKSLVNLRKNKKTVAKKDPKAAKKAFDSLLESSLATSDNENSGALAEEIGDTLTADQLGLLNENIKRCWHLPAGLKNAEELVVEIQMKLNQEGEVTSAEIVDKARMAMDPEFKIAAENAHRAVLDPECQPFPLPKDKYEQWKELDFFFDPSSMY